MSYWRIVWLSVWTSVAYGIAHDLVTARASPAYFLPPHHPVIIDTKSPLVLALIWGVWATWWMGLMGGLLMGAACRAGRLPKLEARDIQPALLKCLAVLWALAMLSGLAIYLFGGFVLGWDEKIADRRLFAVAIAHMFSYSGGTVLIIGLSIWAIWKRFRRPIVQ